MIGERIEASFLGNETLEFNEESVQQDLDYFKERINKLRNKLEENKFSPNFSKDSLEKQDKQIIGLTKTLNYLYGVFRNIKNIKTRLDNNSYKEKDKQKYIRDGKKKLKGLIKQFEYIGLSIYKLEKDLGIEAETDLDRVYNKNKKKDKKVDILKETERLRKERLENQENIRREIEDLKQRYMYDRYLKTSGEEPYGEKESVKLSYWLIRSTKKPGVSYQEKINKYISAAILNPDKYYDKVFKILIKIYGNKKWDKWNLRVINTYGKNNYEKEYIIKPLKKHYLKQCIKNELINYDYGRTLEIVRELKKEGMIEEIKRIEKYLEKEIRFGELQEIQIYRIYGDIFESKLNRGVQSFSIKYDYYNKGELQNCLVVFVDEKHQKIFLDTPEGRKQAQKAEEQYVNSDYVKQREKKERDLDRPIYFHF